MYQSLTEMTYNRSYVPAAETLIDFTDTERTPLVKFNQSNGSLLIRCTRSTPALGDHLRPVNALVTEHLKTNDHLSLFLYFHELRPTLIKTLFDLFKTLRTAHLLGKEISICWLMDVNDDEMIDTAMNFSDIYELNMEIIPR